MPRWYSYKFSDIYEAFSSAVLKNCAQSPNVHLISYYATDPSMFDLDGRHFKSAYGKDFLDHLFAVAEAGMTQVISIFRVTLCG